MSTDKYDKTCLNIHKAASWYASVEDEFTLAWDDEHQWLAGYAENDQGIYVLYADDKNNKAVWIPSEHVHILKRVIQQWEKRNE